ncbi:MAG TPA: glycosyltransferase family 1 protein [Bacteroidetes bacterium]|nr:glycosyltransferase family 1 protein [Bacteroidota bacterium]
MKIVIITEYFPESEKGEASGGVESRAFYIAKGLAKKHEVTVIAGNTGKVSKFANITVLRPAKHKYSHAASIFSRLRFAISAYETAKKIDADVIDGYNFISYLPAYFAGKKTGAKKVATYHETWIGEWVKNKGLFTGILGSLWEQFVLSLKWDKIISVSEFTKKRLVERGVSKEKIFVVPNGVNLPEYAKIKVKKYPAPTICCISRLVKTKRVDDLINAIPLIMKSIPKIKCKIIGVGDELKNLRKLAMELGIEKNVEFLGRVDSNEDVIRILKSSHILCHPSILEGFGMVVIEAMACGVPYVCSDIEPLVEVTGNGKGGLLFKQKDCGDLARKVITLLEDKKLYHSKFAEAIKFVRRYDWKIVTSKTEKVYLQFLK